MYKKIQEGMATILVPEEKKVSKKLPVFYNPLMKLNRDMTILLLNSVQLDDMQIALPLAGTGVRGVRLALELKKGKARSIIMNDMSPEAIKIIKENLNYNYITANIENKEASQFLLESKGFDYIDIDPFGNPNEFLDAAIKRLSRCGILAVTATDTSALCGTYPNVCKRKYWATPIRSEIMHEAGLRILIRRVQLIGTQYDRALTPIFSYSKNHYMRVFFKSKKSKKEGTEIINKHQCSRFQNNEDFGPFWAGQLNDLDIVREMTRLCDNYKNKKFLQTIAQETESNTLFFHDIHKTLKKHKLQKNPKKDTIIEAIKKKGYKATGTHFSPTAIKTDIPYEEFLKTITES